MLICRFFLSPICLAAVACVLWGPVALAQAETAPTIAKPSRHSAGSTATSATAPAPAVQTPAPTKPVNPFAVTGIKVDVEADSAVAARAKAFKRAQQRAFDQLATQVLDSEQRAAYKRPALNVISPMVLDFEVTNERLSATRYMGTYAVKFSPQKVRRYFGRVSTGGAQASTAPVPTTSPSDVTNIAPDSAADMPVRDAPVRPSLTVTDQPLPLAQASTRVTRGSVLVLPYLADRAGGHRLWEDNLWASAWQRLPSDPGAAVQPVIPIGDLTDLRDVPSGDPLQVSASQLAGMRARYDAAAVVIAILEQVENGSASVRLYDASAQTPAYLTTVPVHVSAYERVNVLDRAAALTRREIAKGIDLAGFAQDTDRKTTTAPAPMAAQMYRIIVAFETLAEWQVTRQTLARLQGVSGLRIASLSSASAILDAQYGGAPQEFARTLQLAGFDVQAQATPVTGRPTLSIRKDDGLIQQFMR